MYEALKERGVELCIDAFPLLPSIPKAPVFCRGHSFFPEPLTSPSPVPSLPWCAAPIALPHGAVVFLTGGVQDVLGHHSKHHQLEPSW